MSYGCYEKNDNNQICRKFSLIYLVIETFEVLDTGTDIRFCFCRKRRYPGEKIYILLKLRKNLKNFSGRLYINTGEDDTYLGNTIFFTSDFPNIKYTFK